MIHRIRRSYLQRVVEEYDLELPDDIDPHHGISEHFSAFDDDLTAGQIATLVSQKVEDIDYSELALEVMEREKGKVIPFKRKGHNG